MYLLSEIVKTRMKAKQGKKGRAHRAGMLIEKKSMDHLHEENDLLQHRNQPTHKSGL